MRFHLLNKVMRIRSDRKDLVTLGVKMQQDRAHSVLTQGIVERKKDALCFILRIPLSSFPDRELI